MATRLKLFECNWTTTASSTGVAGEGKGHQATSAVSMEDHRKGMDFCATPCMSNLFRFLLCSPFCVANTSPRTGMPFCFVFVLFHALYANHVASELQTFVFLNDIRFTFNGGMYFFESLLDVHGMWKGMDVQDLRTYNQRARRVWIFA